MAKKNPLDLSDQPPERFEGMGGLVGFNFDPPAAAPAGGEGAATEADVSAAKVLAMFDVAEKGQRGPDGKLLPGERAKLDRINELKVA